jgi:hypothetical protein
MPHAQYPVPRRPDTSWQTRATPEFTRVPPLPSRMLPRSQLVHPTFRPSVSDLSHWVCLPGGAV